ncbi:metallophosphoesterase [Candidatus Magnetomorum sp. HK-1]|nr:metallophosphoesterase [Candidatus Magnetomorum sp. HK-1]
MRIFAISDIHIDYAENLKWLQNLSEYDFQDDILIIAGDITDNIELLKKGLKLIERRFFKVLFIPGNHDIWVFRNNFNDSLECFHHIIQIALDYGIQTSPFHMSDLSIVPLMSWYDYSFGQPDEELKDIWMDFSYCKWPAGFDEPQITQYFLNQNETFLTIQNRKIISFSHFLPRIDLMPTFIPEARRKIYPVLGSIELDKQIRKLGSTIHIYGHSHVNQHIVQDKIIYINNAFGYPHETLIARKNILEVSIF